MRRGDAPRELRQGPFTIAQAEAAGVTRHQLKGTAWRRLTRGSYIWARLGTDPMQRLVAERDRMPRGCAFSGVTAASVYGLDCLCSDRVEVTAPHGVGLVERSDLYIHHGLLEPGDICVHSGLPVTSPVRTCFDLARRLPLVEAVVALDTALHRRMIEVVDLNRYIAERAGWAGVRSARRAVDLAEPATESPMESRLRLVLVLRRLPAPEVQPTIRERGMFVGRLDLYYPFVKLGIEYDGGTHRDSLVADNRRQNRLLSAGISLLRYTASDVYQRPDSIAAEVGARIRTRATSPP